VPGPTFSSVPGPGVAQPQGLKSAMTPLTSVERLLPPPEKPAKAKEKGKVRRKKKKDIPDREEIFDALVKLGHEPVYQVIDGRDQTLVAIARSEADLVFNLTESYAGDDTMELLPERLRDLIDRSLSLLDRVRRLDATMHSPVSESVPNNAVERQLGLLRAAFEREAR